MQLGLLGVLTVLFVLAKILGLVAWPWWVVLSPAIAGASLTALFLFVFLVAAGSVPSHRRRF